MDALVSERGERQRFAFTFRWPGAPLRGELEPWLDGERAWPPGCEPFRWEWSDFLLGLAENWAWLELEEGLPLEGLVPAPLEAIRQKLEERWNRLSRERRLDEEDRVEGFCEAHKLSRWVPGTALPRLWVVREGALAWLLAEEQAVELPAEELLGLLRELGDCLAARLAPEHPAARAWAELR